MNYYEILKIDKDADKQTMKRAYFAAVRQHSPDSDPEMFKQIKNSYETLTDDKKRKEYDSYFTTDDDVISEILSARELMKQKKYKQAIELITALDKEKQERTDIRRLHAEALMNIKKTVTATNICKSILETNPNDVDTLLLIAKISAGRGHRGKADEYFIKATEIDPKNSLIWIEYIKFTAEYHPYHIYRVLNKAIEIDENMLNNEYSVYLRPIMADIRTIIIFNDIDNNNLRYFEKFTELFIADKDPDEETFFLAQHVITVLCKQIEYLPLIEKILPAMLESKYAKKDKEEADYFLKNVNAAIGYSKLKADKRIHEVIAELTSFLLEGNKDINERLYMECFIVFNIYELRKSLKILRKEYPQYFKLHSFFYLNVLDPKKEVELENKYNGIYKRLPKEKD